MSTVESIARPRRNGERRRAPTASISKESPAITGVVEMVIRRSEERFSRNAETDLVCRLLLEKKNNDSKVTNWATNQLSAESVLADFDAVLLAGGAEQSRDLPVPGRDLDGVFFFMESSTTEIYTLSLHDALPI